MKRSITRCRPKGQYSLNDTVLHEPMATRIDIDTKRAIHVLVLSFRPLLALRIDFRECDTFFFGTASTIEGKSSSSGARRDGNASEVGHEKADGEAAWTCSFPAPTARRDVTKAGEYELCQKAEKSALSGPGP